MNEMASPESSIEEKLRQMISQSIEAADLYKAALGTIVEQRCCIEDWQRRSMEWCKQCDKAQQACESDGETDEKFEGRVCRDAFLDGANWLEHWLRDKPLGALLTRRVQDEAAKRWPDGERNG